MISHRYKCIFIHIPKTAGTSIEKRLGHFDTLEPGVQDHTPIRSIEPLRFREVVKFMGRNNMDVRTRYDHIKRYLNPPVSSRQYNEYYKFTFVRNPWARVYSWYKNVLSWEPHQKELGITADCTFEDFIKEHLNQWALKPQLHWIKDRKGKVAVNFIGRFENLNNDFEFVAGKLGLENHELPKMLVSGNQHYTKFYTDELVDRINEYYKEEIEMFHFKYGE